MIRKKTNTLLLSVVTLFMALTIFGMSSLAASPAGTSEEASEQSSVSAISSETTSEETSSAEASSEETSSDATPAGASAGFSGPMLRGGISAFSSVSPGTTTHRYTGDGFKYLPSGPGGTPIWGGTMSTQTGLDPYNSLGAAATDPFRLPNLQGAGEDTYGIEEFTFNYRPSGSGSSSIDPMLEFLFDNLYLGCGAQFVAYLDSAASSAGATAGTTPVITYGNVTGFMSDITATGFWGGYATYINSAGVRNSITKSFNDSKLPAFETVLGSQGITTKVDIFAQHTAPITAGEKIYYLDLTSAESVQGKDAEMSIWYYLLGLSGPNTTIEIYGVGGTGSNGGLTPGSNQWDALYTAAGVSTSYSGMVWPQFTLDGFGTGNSVHTGVTTNINILGDNATISGFWGAQSAPGGYGGSNRRFDAGYKGTLNIKAYGSLFTDLEGQSLSKNVQKTTYFCTSLGADQSKVIFEDTDGIKAIDFSSWDGKATSGSDLTLPDFLTNTSLQNRSYTIEASPVLFGVITQGTGGSTDFFVDVSSAIDFIVPGGFTAESNTTPSRVPMISDIGRLSIHPEKDNWTTTTPGEDPQYHVNFASGLGLGNNKKNNFFFEMGNNVNSTINIDSSMGGTTPYTFLLHKSVIGSLTASSTTADFKLVNRASYIKTANLLGTYTGSTTTTDRAAVEAGVSNHTLETLTSTSYFVASHNHVEGTDLTTGGNDTGAYIENLIFGDAGTTYNYTDVDLRFANARQTTLDGNYPLVLEVMLPDIIEIPTISTLSPTTSDSTFALATGAASTTNTLKLYGPKVLTSVALNGNTSINTLDLSYPGSQGTVRSNPYPARLTKQPPITGWNATAPKVLLIKDSLIEEIHSFIPGTGTPFYPVDITSLDVTSPLGGNLKVLDIPQRTPHPAVLETLRYKQGNEATLVGISFEDQTALATDGGAISNASISRVLSKKNEVGSADLTALEKVNYNGLTQISDTAQPGVTINLSDNKINNFQISNTTTSVTGAGLDDLNLSNNQLSNIQNKEAIGAGNEFSAKDTIILGKIDFSKNILNTVVLDGDSNTENKFGKTINLSAQKNQVSVPELGVTWGDISGGVVVQNNVILETLDISSDKITDITLKDLTVLEYLEGTNHHSQTPSGVPATLIAGEATFDNVNALKSPSTASGKSELNLEGHAITYLEVINMSNFDVLNFRRQNSTGDVAPAATQGELKTVNLLVGSGTDLDTLDVSYNSIERINNGGLGRAVGSVRSGSLNFTGSTFVGNATINADFNNIDEIDVVSARFTSGSDTLKVLRVNDNLLKDITYVDSNSLTEMMTNRSVEGRNTFVDGKVILTNDTTLKYFAPATSLAKDKDEDSKFNRINPVIPSESRWALDSPGGTTPTAADFSNLSAGTFGTEFGFYISVPITDLDVSGNTSMTTLRVPGNHLTNASINWSNTGNMEFLDVSGAPYLITDSSGTHAGTSTVKTRGGRYTTLKTKDAGVQEAGSGQITGTFIGQWPKLQSMYIQNNRIQQLDIGTSTNTVHILAYQNQLGQGVASDAVKVSTATALKVLDVERNPNINILTVPTQNLEILRAGLAGLTQYPNVQNISTLKQLYVDHNNLSGVAEPVAGNPNLEVLNISGNGITELPNVSTLAKLEEYYAYNNQATSLGTFNSSGALAVVDVADNLLSAWPELPSSIVYLDLSRNRFGGVLDIPSIPAGLSRSTPYTVKAHEVNALENDTATGGTYYVQTDEFYGTFAIEDNQITALPPSMKQAYIDMINNVSGRPAYRMYVNWNVLDIDTYGLDANGNPVATYAGTQKWVVMYPGITPTILNYVNDERLEMVLRGSVGLYDPRSGLPVDDINGFEAPYSYQEWEYGWEDDAGLIYNGEIDSTGVGIAKVRIVDNPGRNGRALVGIALYDHLLETNPANKDKKDKDGKIVVDGSQDAGQVLDELKGNNSNYNPNTGGEIAE